MTEQSAPDGVNVSFNHKDSPARAFIGSGQLLFGTRVAVQAVAVRRK